MEKTEMLHKLCKALTDELDEYSKKIEKADKMSAGDLAAVDTLSHALKSIKTTIAMMEAGEEEGGYSGRYMPRMGAYYGPGGMSYNDGMSYADGERMGDGRGSSYARGRTNARRDSMGRYSREGGYSYAAEMDGIMEDLRGLMADMPADKQRTVERLMAELQR